MLDDLAPMVFVCNKHARMIAKIRKGQDRFQEGQGMGTAFIKLELYGNLCSSAGYL